MKYIYDICLHGELVGDSGDEIFDTKEEARADARDYAEDLATDYDCSVSDLEICVFEADNVGDSVIEVFKPIKEM